MPTPTSAVWIMLTSFAPSPIARQIASVWLFTQCTICAFCSGVTCAHTTESTSDTSSMNSAACRLTATCVDCPLTTSAMPSWSSPRSAAARYRCASATACCISASPSLPFPPSPSRSVFTTMRCAFSRTSRHDLLMLMAVSCLSPVIIHTWMPARSRLWIASGTPSCSLSSTAVHPSSVMPVSISSNSARTAASRSPTMLHASS